MTAIKKEHLNIRLDEYSKKKIEQAAAVVKSSVNNFIITAVLEKAQEIIEAQEEIILSDRDGEIFFDAILNPPSPNKALYDAFVQHSQLVKSDV
ncbi:MAG TPA: DUF1778 domain-containing protein [Allocoleopsis sp.]